jgi:hypothetical protein
MYLCGMFSPCQNTPEAFVSIVYVLMALGSFCLIQEPKAAYSALTNMFTLPRGWSNGIFTTTLAISFVFLGLGYTGMFPWWVNASAYLVSLVVIVFVSVWSKIEWTRSGRIAAVGGYVLYCAFFGIVSYKQYEKENHIDLVFQDSKYLTSWRKTVIRHDMAQMKAYLLSLNIPVPLAIPPIGVQESSGCGAGENNAILKPIFRSTIKINSGCVCNRRLITSFYVEDAFESSRPSKSVNFQPSEFIRFVALRAAFESYFNWSFWGKAASLGDLDSEGIVGGVDILWKVRETFGQDFTDELVAFSALSTIADPLEGFDQDTRIYLARKLKIGASVKDDGTKWPKILQILKEAGVPIEKI